MKLRVFLLSVASLFLASCGSKKNVVTAPSKKVVVIEDVPIETTPPEIYELEQVKRAPVKITTKNTQEYIEKFAPIAIREMQLYKIPASITLAQGILESGSGRSHLAIRSNNHFGIKCHRGWQGKSVTHDDDEIGECFRKYEHPESSYEDHSKFLTSRKRYSRLFRLKTTDYKGWAYGLKRAGYATDKKYPQKLIGLIKRYKLDKYDLKKTVAKNRPKYTGKLYYEVQKGDTLYSIARRHNITVKRLKKINGLVDNTISIGQELIITN